MLEREVEHVVIFPMARLIGLHTPLDSLVRDSAAKCAEVCSSRFRISSE